MTIEEMDAKYGKPDFSIKSTPDKNKEDIQSNLDFLYSSLGIENPNTTTQEKLKKQGDQGFIKGLPARVAEQQLGGAKKIASSVKSGARQIQEGADMVNTSIKPGSFVNPLKPNTTPEQKDSMRQNLVNGIKGGAKVAEGEATSALGTITGVAETALAPATAVVSPIISKEIPAAIKVLKFTHPTIAKLWDTLSPEVQTRVTPKLNEFADKHPDATALAGDVANTLLLAVGGGEVEAPVKEALGNALTKEGFNTAKESVTSIPGDVISGVKNASAKIASKTQEKALSDSIKAVSSTEETMSKAQRIKAIEEGRLNPTKLGGKEYLPSKTEQRAGEILNGKVKGNPITDLPIVKNEIATRGAEAEQFLKENAKPITAKEQFDMFNAKRAEYEKYATDSEIKAYDEQVKLFSKQLPGRGGYDTHNFYTALKDYESNVADKLPRGHATLIDPTGIANAKLRAASDVRTIVRDMIGSKHPEFKPKMFDLASLYDAKDNVITKADLKGKGFWKNFVKEHPAAAAAIGLTGTALLGETASKIAHAASN